MVKRSFALALVIAVGFAVDACAPFANTVSDNWPTWAGGMPKDVPPRPGAPGYDEFLLRQQGKDVTSSPAPSGRADATPVPTVAPSNNVYAPPPQPAAPPYNANARSAPASGPPRNDQAAVQGGLY